MAFKFAKGGIYIYYYTKYHLINKYTLDKIMINCF